MKKTGFTLVELLVVFSILAIMAVITIGIINPIAQMNKGKDAQMKKDLSRIRVAFEEYYSDRECFPDQVTVATLMLPVSCDQEVFSPWLPRWACDPGGNPYKIVVQNATCPKWYKIMANLRNKKDADIPVGWYDGGTRNVTEEYTNLDVNYGVSSQNILWSDLIPD